MIKKLIAITIFACCFAIGYGATTFFSKSARLGIQFCKELSPKPTLNKAEKVVFYSPAGCPVSLGLVECQAMNSGALVMTVQAINTGTRSIRRLSLRAKAEYSDYRPSDSDYYEVDTSFPTDLPFLPTDKIKTKIGYGIGTKSEGKPVGPLSKFTVYVGLVEFADGTSWTPKPINGKSRR